MDIEKEIGIIKERNKRVESDKGWETSWTRRLFIAAVTYVIALAWMVIIHETIPYLKAVVPVAGYILSTLSLPVVKRWWVSKTS
ncbi:MAG: hypothetical protein WC120_02825 [Parcubacteria group bacterium]